MRIVPPLIATFLVLGGMLQGEEPKLETPSPDGFFDRLDTNGDGKVTLAEAPEQGKMLVEFLLRHSSREDSDHLNRSEFMRLTQRHSEAMPKEAAVAAFAVGDVRPAPQNCPAFAMGLTAEFVFKRLDVDEDKLVTVTEFMRSPGMDDEEKSREVVGRLDKSGDVPKPPQDKRPQGQNDPESKKLD